MRRFLRRTRGRSNPTAVHPASQSGPLVTEFLSSGQKPFRHLFETPIMSTKPTQPTFMFIFRNPADFPKPAPEEMQKNFQKWIAWIEGIKAKGQYIGGDPLEDSPGKVLR